MTLDEALLRQIVALRSLPLDILFGVTWLLTLFDWVWLALALFALRDGRRGRWVTASVVIALVTAAIVVDLVLKPAFARARPFTSFPDLGPYLIPLVSTTSFPSGDVAGAFAAVAAFTAFRPWWSLPLYGFAGLVAIERIYFGVHYPSDVLGGAVIGFFCGRLAVEIVRFARTRLPWRAIVVPHTHWDREWYETVAGYRPRLLAAVDGVVAELERPGGVDRFTFDGQTVALEDYLGDRPAMTTRIDALVRAGKLLVGPWYVLSDLILVHAESTLRNMEEGLRLAASHGRAMRVGYVADPFGHPAQMPQILRGFGYGSYVFARGLGDEGEVLGSEFEWEAPSGDRVLAIHLVGHYDNALWLIRDGRHVEEADPQWRTRLRRELPRLLARETPYAHSDVLLLMVGTDHTPITPELLPALEHAKELRPRLATKIGTLEDAVEAYPTMSLPVHSREMIDGRYRPILRAVNSTRMWIKQENAACERLLLRWLEPFGALSGKVTREELRPLWRTLLQCHPHDSICGCSIDAVHEIDMRERFAAVRAGGEALRERLLRADGGTPVGWSVSAFPRSAVIDDDRGPRLVRFEGIGAAPLDAAATPEREVRSTAEGVLDNGLIRLEVSPDGSFYVAGPGGRTGPHNVLVDEGDRGDEYTYSYAGPPVRSSGRAGARETRAHSLRGEVVVRFALSVPVALRSDRRARDERLLDLPVETVIRLDAEADRVEVTTTIDNRARDHRLRALFATGRSARTHVAGEQFAWVRRANRVTRKSGWAEQPPDTSHVQDFVAVADAVGGVVLAGDGLPEYAVLGDGREIALTLLRCVGYLSRGDLPERRGHAGPQLETPGAQMQGRWTMRYALIPVAAQSALASAARSARQFREPPLLGRAAPGTRFALESDGAIELSALRPGHESNTLVLRLANPSAVEASARVRFGMPVRVLRTTDLREGEDDLGANGLAVIRTAAPLDELPDGRLEARLQPYEIGTWLLERRDVRS
ncbi:MAG: hypothetical protein AUH85_10710 [Chloroflexi bacterium 13_1_40CM_4_68_4]|nr:MAG: hypothetical protein AUH85_10710 [Chloroflexi bacterium 13_1_40CM_4_68_4]